MKLGGEIIVHVSEEAKRKWEKAEHPRKKKSRCPSCEILTITEEDLKEDYINKEIK
jgi:hypothetical protein